MSQLPGRLRIELPTAYDPLADWKELARRIQAHAPDVTRLSRNSGTEVSMTNETKALVIEARIPVPADLFAGNEIVGKVYEAYKAFQAALDETVGENDYTLTVSEQKPKKTRVPRSDAGQTRAPRGSRKPANGAADQPLA